MDSGPANGKLHWLDSCCHTPDKVGEASTEPAGAKSPTGRETSANGPHEPPKDPKAQTGHSRYV